jgi:drug/metabolite transporter (DMT)-like permease
MTRTTESQPWHALLWMLGAMVSFLAMAIAGREVQAQMTTFQLMVYRSIIGWLIMLVVVLRAGRGFAPVHTRLPWLHLRRNVVHYIGQNAWFLGVALIPLGQVVALEMTNPIWVAVLAPFLLGERMTRARAIAALLGFLGVLVVARPGVSPLGWGHAATLLAAISFALTSIITRRITYEDSAICVLFWMTFSQSIMSIVICLATGGLPLPEGAIGIWLCVAGVTGVSAHFFLTSALRCAPASVVAPMEFLRLPAMAVAGTLIYGEPLEWAVFAGGALIVTGIFLNVLGEGRRARA